MMERIFRRLSSLFYVICNKRRFGQIGQGCRIYRPLKIQGKSGIFFGNRVVVERGAWLAAMGIEQGVAARLTIGQGTNLGHFNHIYATRSITIGANVLTADRVYISDNLHGYQDISTPILHQPIKQIGAVEIGDGSWLGEGVCVVGAKIGKGCVVGANAVVTKDIPDYSVAVGIPAKVIKRYNHASSCWEPTNQ